MYINISNSILNKDVKGSNSKMLYVMLFTYKVIDNMRQANIKHELIFYYDMIKIWNKTNHEIQWRNIFSNANKIVYDKFKLLYYLNQKF